MGNENSLGRPGGAAIDGPTEPQLARGRLEARPGDVDIVAVLAARIGTDGQPFLVAPVVHLHDGRIAPGVSAVRRLVDHDRARGIRIGGAQVREVERAVPIDADRRIAECLRAARGRWHRTGGPCLAAVIRHGITREPNPIDNQPGPARIRAHVKSGRVVEGHDDVTTECCGGDLALRRSDEWTETREDLCVVLARIADLQIAAAKLDLRDRGTAGYRSCTVGQDDAIGSELVHQDTRPRSYVVFFTELLDEAGWRVILSDGRPDERQRGRDRERQHPDGHDGLSREKGVRLRR